MKSARPLALPSEKDVKALARLLRDLAAEVRDISVELAENDRLTLNRSQQTMLSAAFSLEMLSKLIPARGPFDG